MMEADARLHEALAGMLGGAAPDAEGSASADAIEEAVAIEDLGFMPSSGSSRR